MRATKPKEKGSFVFELSSEFAPDEEVECFETVIEPLLDDLLAARKLCESRLSEVNETGRQIRPLRPAEAFSASQTSGHNLTTSQALLQRKLKIEALRRNFGQQVQQTSSLTLPDAVSKIDANVDVMDSLNSIESTPFSSSFLSRLHGGYQPPAGLIAIDWETQTPWMDLMVDIRDHYSLAHPDREQPMEYIGPITYTILRQHHLPQVHDLLERSFWPGIDVSDSLDFQPEKATVLAMYKTIVVGVAILKSPWETYIMYLAVKAGWDKSQIARSMLYYMIMLNPHKDITLHVSTNNSAMILYNQFGFKVEEFVAGFYSKYLDPQSRLSNNAFKLRLRHLRS